MSVSSIFLPEENLQDYPSVKNSFRSMSEIMLLKASLSGSNLLPKRTESLSHKKDKAYFRVRTPRAHVGKSELAYDALAKILDSSQQV